MGIKNKEGRNHKNFKKNHPPKKNITKCIEDITKCKYSHNKNNINIAPLYSTAYPATTSDSVSAWSNGVLFASNNKIIIKPEPIETNKKKNQYIFWFKIKSWKFADWELKTNKEYKIVIKISKDITWIKDLTVPIIAYLDWLNNPTNTKKILLNSIKIKWYKINESTFSNMNIEGPTIKFCENINWEEYNNDKKIGANKDVVLGIKKISFVTNFTKSNKIWKRPFRPIIAGPIRLWAYAKNFLSNKTTNNVINIINKEIIKEVSLIFLKY